MVGRVEGDGRRRALGKVKMEMGQCNPFASRIDGIDGCTNDAKNIVHHATSICFCACCACDRVHVNAKKLVFGVDGWCMYLVCLRAESGRSK